VRQAGEVSESKAKLKNALPITVRKLYLVPIIHATPDMGSLASALDQRAIAELGQELWQKHKEVVSGFWDSIARFFRSLDVNGFKVYQDGLVADGAEGLRIIKEGISQGSTNFEIIGNFIERGAILVQTEDMALVKQEYAYISRMAHSKSLKDKEIVAFRYKLVQNKLLRQRDDFITKRINETLGECETGILFIGASHDILSRLPDDIQVSQVKDVARVREYHTTLANPKKRDQRFHFLAQYLISPVTDLVF
jgi:hypothetical protein